MKYTTAQRIVYPLKDPVDADLNRYLAKYDRETHREESIETMAATLLDGDYSPFLPQNVAEALGEMPKETLAVLACGLKINGFDGVGSLLKKYIESYWVDLATRKAADMYDDGDKTS